MDKLNQPLVRFIPLGGMGDVTKNMYVYEYIFGVTREILIVDCGIGFPDRNMYGVDLVIPDASYVIANKKFVKGIVLTHGHEDHISALPYILPNLNVPVYATRLTGALAKVKLEENNLSLGINILSRDKRLKLGIFDVEFVHITHSIPDANNLIIRTPIGVFYHGSDFKFDWTPVDGDATEVHKIVTASSEGIINLATDCLGSNRPGYTFSEKVIESALDAIIVNCKGKFIVTTQSSNISRIKQAIDISLKHRRRFCLVGRSVKENVAVSEKLGYIKLPNKYMLQVKDLKKFPKEEITLIVTGSQGQVDAALSRIATGEFPGVNISKDDVVVFSSDPIPGNEEIINSLIDTLVDVGAKVYYSDIFDDLHVSGHGSSNDLLLMLSLTRPRYAIPIGGTRRHMYHYRDLASLQGIPKDNVFILENGQSVEFSKTTANLGKRIVIDNIMVDGLGVGDVGNVVLRDRRKMAADGIVVAIIPFDKNTYQITGEIDVISRGFVYMRESLKLITATKQEIIKSMLKLNKTPIDLEYVKKGTESIVEKFLYFKTHRRPMVIVVLVET